MIDAALVQNVFSGLVLLLGAVTGVIAARGRRASVQRRDYRRLQRQFLAALGHIFRLESALAERGITPPERPAVLDQEDDDDPAPPAPALPPTPRPADSGAPRHGA